MPQKAPLLSSSHSTLPWEHGQLWTGGIFFANELALQGLAIGTVSSSLCNNPATVTVPWQEKAPETTAGGVGGTAHRTPRSDS